MPASREWTDKALVIQVGRFREADMWVRLLTRRQGVLTAFAFGGSRSRRRFCGCLDIGNSILCRVKSARAAGYLALQEASLLLGLRRLRTDGQRLGLAMNCLRFLELLEVQGEEAQGVFAHLAEIDALIDERLKDWDFGRLAKADLAILRLALYEIRFAPDISAATAIDQAVELAKIYGADEAPAFINGLLGRAVEA